MPTKIPRCTSKLEPPDHPVVPGSILYRALLQVARAVAQRLAVQPDSSQCDNDPTKCVRESTGLDPDRGSPRDAR
jgi:hypothetical protein